ncbi:MAG: TPM domain-containing protein [Neisseriaceae bacterium]
MWKFLRLVFTVVLFALAGLVSFADDLVKVPVLKSPVVDTVNLLSVEERGALSQSLLDFYRDHGSQVVVLIVPTTGAESLFDYASRVFDQWRIGRKGIDDGILLVVSVEDRKVGIYPGSGLEGAVPDLLAKRIIDQVLQPEFRKGQYFSGLYTATQFIEKLILKEELPALKRSSTRGNFFSVILFFLILQSFLGGLRQLVGKVFPSVLSAGMTGGLAMLFHLPLWLIFPLMGLGFLVTYLGLMEIFSRASGLGYWGGGRWPGGGSFGGGFGGGGGGFSGGGASGSW